MKAARVAAARQAAEQAEAQEAAIKSASARVAAGAVAAVLARYPRRDQPKGARSQEAKRRRYAKLKAKKQQRLQSLAGTTTTMEVAAHPPPTEATAQVEATLRESQLREAALWQQLQAKTAQVLSRARRDAKTTLLRGKQAERRNGKAAARKRKAGQQDAVRRAVRKADERERKRKTPTGEALHSGERKHRRLTGGGGGGNS